METTITIKEAVSRLKKAGYKVVTERDCYQLHKNGREVSLGEHYSLTSLFGGLLCFPGETIYDLTGEQLLERVNQLTEQE